MDKRTLILLAGLLLPIIALAFLAQSEPREQPVASVQQNDTPEAAPKNLPAAQSLEDARARARLILDTLNKMTPEEWEAEQARRAGRMAQPSAQEAPPAEPRELPAPQTEEEKN